MAQFFPINENSTLIFDKNETQLVVAQPGGGGVVTFSEGASVKYDSYQALQEATGIKLKKPSKKKIFNQVEKVFIKGIEIKTDKIHEPFPSESVKYTMPIFRKSALSDVHYAAGHYVMDMGTYYAIKNCPRVSTLMENCVKYYGPFKDSATAKTEMKSIRKNK